MGFKNDYERSKEVIIDANLDIGTKELKKIVTYAKGQTLQGIRAFTNEMCRESR